MKGISYIQPIIRLLLPPELQPYADAEIWKALGHQLLGKLNSRKEFR